MNYLAEIKLFFAWLRKATKLEGGVTVEVA